MHSLPEAARRALLAARDAKISYAVRIVRAPDGRTVALLGEAHMKLAAASELGKAVVGAFELRGVETFQKKQVTWGRALGFVIHAPRALLRALSFGAIKDSTIIDAKQLPSGYTVELERAKSMPPALHVASVYMTTFFVASFSALFVPVIAPFAPVVAALLTMVAVAFQVHALLLIPAFVFRHQPWSWLVHPFLGILHPRDVLMARGTVRMLDDHPRETSAILVMGRAHVEGVVRLLVERHGFTVDEL